jgi:hypothetical protein
MKTIETQIFEFSELDSKVQQKILDRERENAYTDHVWDEAYNTVKKFNDVFDVNEGSRSWLDYSLYHIEDNIRTELTGLRLRKYLINNFWSQIYKGKYYGKLTDRNADGTQVEKSKEHPIGKRHIKRYSKVTFEDCCALTGVYFDNEMLSPVYDIIDNYKEEIHGRMNFDDIIGECFYNIKKAIESEVEELTSDEYLQERIEEEGTMYFENGTEFIR